MLMNGVEGGGWRVEPLTGWFFSSILWGEHEGASWRFVGGRTIILDNCARVLSGFLRFCWRVTESKQFRRLLLCNDPIKQSPSQLCFKWTWTEQKPRGSYHFSRIRFATGTWVYWLLIIDQVVVSFFFKPWFFIRNLGGNDPILTCAIFLLAILLGRECSTTNLPLRHYLPTKLGSKVRICGL